MKICEEARQCLTYGLFRASFAPLCIIVLELSGHLAAKAEPRIIDLSNYRLTFSEDFRGPLQVTPWGPSRWIAHTPWNGDFGDARFADPIANFPFITGGEGL